MTPARLFDMTGKHALVTGGGTGLGKCFAMTLAEAGATVTLSARRRDVLEATAAQVRTLGRPVHCIALDVTDGHSVQDAMTAAEAVAPVDVLVNNAGVAIPAALLDMSEETWDAIADVNVKGAWLVARALAQRVIARKGTASIINIASVLHTAVQKGTANYAAAKAALAQLTRSMAVEWARYGIRVNALAPGYFRTELSGAYLESENGKAMLKGMPLRRLGDPEELAGALLLLASGAASYMTGSVVAVDGGLALRAV